MAIGPQVQFPLQDPTRVRIYVKRPLQIATVNVEVGGQFPSLASSSQALALGSASLSVQVGWRCVSRRETASEGMQKAALSARPPNQDALGVEREVPGWSVLADCRGLAACPVCGVRSRSRHSSYLRSPRSSRSGDAGHDPRSADPLALPERIVNDGSLLSVSVNSPRHTRAERHCHTNLNQRREVRKSQLNLMLPSQLATSETLRL